MMGIFGELLDLFREKKFDPALIDLQDYEARLLRQRDQGIPLQPVPPIPGRQLDWTAEEMEAMEKNHRVAEEIYKRIVIL